MRRPGIVVGLLPVLLLVACGGGGGDGSPKAAPAADPGTTVAAGPCGLRPLTFVNERWQASAAGPPSGPGVLWEQEYTFSNPNTVDVRLSSLVVHLRLSGSGGYFFKFARSTFRPAADEVVPAGRDQKRYAEVWLAPGNTAATEDLYATTSAKVAGADCPVAVERISTAATPGHVLALPSCDPRDAGAAC